MTAKGFGAINGVLAAVVPGPALAAADTTIALLPTIALAVVGAAVVALWVMQRWRAARLVLDKNRLASLVDSAPGGHVHVGASGAVCSPQLARLLGVAAGSVTTLEELARHFDREAFARLMDRLAAGEAAAPFSLTLVDAGCRRTFEVEGGPLAGGAEGGQDFVLWFRDVSAGAGALSRTAHHLAEAKNRHRSLAEVLDSAPLPMWRRDGDLALSWCNQAYARHVDTDPATAVAGAGIELSATAGPDTAGRLARRARDSGVAQSEARRVVVGGELRTYEITEAPVADGAAFIGFARDISDLDALRAELMRHTDANAALLETLTTAVAITGPDKRLQFYNRAYARLWQLDEHWLRGAPHHGDILEKMRELRRLPEQADFPAYKKSIFDLYTTLIDSREELLHLPDGTTLRAVTTPHAHGGLLFFYEDVSDRLELERARNTLVAVQRATIDHLSQGIAVFGSDGRLKLFNPVFAQIWQLDPSYLDTRPHVSDVVDRGRALLDVDEDWQARRARIIAHTLEREPRFARVERPDGLVLDYASAPLPDGGMLFTYLDVTDSTHVERALRDRTEALEAADKLKSEFIANVSHQLRTPLNTIIGFSEILRDAYFGPLTDRQREYNTGVLESSQHLLTLINDILDLAMIEAGRMVLETHPFEIQPMLTSVLGLARERSLRRKVTLEFDCPRDIGRLDADERRIKQVLFNLVSNA